MAYALHRHKDSPDVAAMACRAVRNLSCIDEIAAKLIQEGTLEGLIEVLKNALTDGYNQETVEVWMLDYLGMMYSIPLLSLMLPQLLPVRRRHVGQL